MISPTRFVMSLVSSLLTKLRQQHMAKMPTTSSATSVASRMTATCLWLLGFSVIFQNLSLQYLGGEERLSQMVCTTSSISRLPLQTIPFTATSGKLSNPTCVSRIFQMRSVSSTGLRTLTSSMPIFLRMPEVQSSRAFQSPSQYSSKRFMQAIHCSAPRWVKMAYWWICSRRIFCPTFGWAQSQSQQQALRKQFSLLQAWQGTVWQTGSKLMCPFRWEYSWLNCRRKMQVLRLAAETKRLTVLTFAFGTGNLAVISTLRSRCSASKEAVVMKRQVMCTFLPLPSSASMTLPCAQSAVGAEMMSPLAPMSWATSARLVSEQVSWQLVRTTRQVGFLSCSYQSGFSQSPLSMRRRSKLTVLPQGTSPKLAQKQGMVLLGKSVTSGLVMMMVPAARATAASSAINLIIQVMAGKQHLAQQYTLKMEALINNLLRPYRSTYSALDLGRKRTEAYTRTDGSITNDRDQLLQYSYYQNARQSDVCVVYCHCNSGSRIEGVQYLEQLVEKGWNVCLFDFSGSGQSQGGFISLGHYEARDLDCVVRKMRGVGNRRLLLWGRSMGAATIIFYLNECKFRDDIIACVLDSPYASLWSLIKQIGQERSMLPGFIIERVLDYIRDCIKEEHLFDIKQLEPLQLIGGIEQPILFITSLIDECVRSEDVVQLYKRSGARVKQLEYIDKAHNSARDRQTVDLAISFLYKNLSDRSKKKKQMTLFVKNNKDLTGANMADLIVRAEREKSQIRRMKSEHNIDRSAKENKDRVNVHIKTELTSTHSLTLTDKSKASLDATRKGSENRKAIKFSLAHIEQKRLAETKNMTMNPYKS